MQSCMKISILINFVRLKENRKTLLQHLKTLYKLYGHFATNNSYFVVKSQNTIQKIFQKIRGTRDYDNKESLKYPSHIGGFKVVRVRDLTVGFDSETGLPKLPCSRESEMITFRLENGAVITVRTSGTEPKVLRLCYIKLTFCTVDQILFRVEW